MNFVLDTILMISLLGELEMKEPTIISVIRFMFWGAMQAINR